MFGKAGKALEMCSTAIPESLQHGHLTADCISGGRLLVLRAHVANSHMHVCVPAGTVSMLSTAEQGCQPVMM